MRELNYWQCKWNVKFVMLAEYAAYFNLLTVCQPHG